eukprot:6466404-Amphidinium_carterae.1
MLTSLMGLYTGQLNAFWIDLYPDAANFEPFWANMFNNFRQGVPHNHCKITLSTRGLNLEAAWMTAIAQSFEKYSLLAGWEIGVHCASGAREVLQKAYNISIPWGRDLGSPFGLLRALAALPISTRVVNSFDSVDHAEYYKKCKEVKEVFDQAKLRRQQESKQGAEF